MKVEDIKNVTALIPMKGHSERVPNKNMRLFSEKPLYHQIVKSLYDSKYISSIVINTDSQTIANDALSNFKGIKIIERPKNIQGDFVAMNDVIAYDLSQLNGEHFLQTHSTNPLLSASSINKAIEAYFEKLDIYDSLFSVTRLHTRLYWDNGKPINHNPDILLRTQDLPPVFEENSNLYIFSKKSFNKAGGKRIGLKPQMFEIEKIEATDIDEELDFKLAESIYKFNQLEKNIKD